MGSTGSGKSTLLSLIPKMYKATSGEILLNYKNVNDWEIESLRDAIGYVPQKHCYSQEQFMRIYNLEIHQLKVKC